jgi:hypothetical protein
VTVALPTADDTAFASAGDYQRIDLTVLTFAPGEMKKTVTVQVTGDSDSELNETFRVNLSDASGAIIADGQALGTIVNDDLAQAARLQVTLVLTPTSADPNGEVISLPDSQTWLDEWSSFSAEIWADTPQSDTVGVAGASFRLAFSNSYVGAPTVEPGPAFRAANGNATSTIDVNAGRIDFAGTTSLTNVGDDQPVLVARVTFPARSGGPGVPHSRNADYIQAAVGDWMSLASGGIDLVGLGPAVVTLGESPRTEMWPLGYDVDDDGQISFGDLAFLGTAFQQTVGAPGALFAGAVDFDHSGKVDFGDVAFFASNFSRAALDGKGPIVYPDNFPEAWRRYQVETIQVQQETQHKLLHDGFQFGTVIETANQAVIFRPHPDLADADGWGSSLYINPYLAGADAGSGQVDLVAHSDGVEIAASGSVNRAGASTFGTWTWKMRLSYDPATQRVTGTAGQLEVTLTDTLAAGDADLNLYRLASNYLDDVPLQTGGTGDTGDMKHALVSYAADGDPRDFTWVPPNQPAHFPQDASPYLSIDVVGTVNLADPVPNKTPRKPSLGVTLIAQTPGTSLIAGLAWDVSKGKDFAADNVGITPLVLKDLTTGTRFEFAVALESTPPEAA